jgi:hypothetical protein
MLDRAKFPVIIRWNFSRERVSRISDFGGVCHDLCDS